MYKFWCSWKGNTNFSGKVYFIVRPDVPYAGFCRRKWTEKLLLLDVEISETSQSWTSELHFPFSTSRLWMIPSHEIISKRNKPCAMLDATPNSHLAQRSFLELGLHLERFREVVDSRSRYNWFCWTWCRNVVRVVCTQCNISHSRNRRDDVDNTHLTQKALWYIRLAQKKRERGRLRISRMQLNEPAPYGVEMWCRCVYVVQHHSPEKNETRRCR